MKKHIILFTFLLLLTVPCVMAGPATLRISPEWPNMNASPATFTIWCESGTSYDVNILLVMTESSYNSLADTDSVIVTQQETEIATFDKTDFQSITGMGGVYVPTSGTHPGARYQVSSLKDHLDLGLSDPLESSDPIYWAMKPLLDTLGTDSQEITITLDSDNPRMLVYLLGKTSTDATLFDMRIPPTPAGFVIPEPATIFMAASGLLAFAFYAYKRKHK